jgi:5,10-methylenetetrahydromethanopterin reductase
VIAAAARSADRIMFALGADLERIRWGIEMARAARRVAGLDPDGIAFGAYVNAISHPDLETARALVRGGLSTFARFAIMHGKVTGPASQSQQRVLADVHRAYDMKAHTRTGSPQADLLTPEFVDRYAVVGPPERCIERLSALAGLGLSRLVVIGPTQGADRAEARKAQALFAQAVLPAFAGR